MRTLNKIERREKEYRALRRKQEKLYRAKMDLGYVVLEKPIRHGWYKHLMLREDVAKRKDAAVFQEILDKCGQDIWGSDKKHADKKWNKVNSQREYVQYAGLRRISGWQYAQLSLKARKWFEPFDWRWDSYRGYVKRYHCLIPRNYFVQTYTRAYITKRRVIDSEIERHITEVDEKLLNDEFYNLSKMHRWFYRDYNIFYHKQCRRRLKMALEDYEDDKNESVIYEPYKRRKWW